MPPTVSTTVAEIVNAPSWNTRVNLVRQIPEQYGRARLRDVFAELAKELYVPQLTPDFAYVHWRDEYELPPTVSAYEQAYEGTHGFTSVSMRDIQDCLMRSPASLRIFRLFLGYTTKELAAATIPLAAELNTRPATDSRIKSMETGRSGPPEIAQLLAEAVTRGIKGDLFSPPGEGLRSKQDRPDLVDGWNTIRRYANDGVPFPIFLHQRHYGGAFRQLLDATSGKRGDRLEDAVEELFTAANVRFIRTGSSNQAEIAERFNLTVQPAPDFVLYDEHESLRGILECKATNDGGTARDKAARFRSLRDEAKRLGGIPVFAVLSGLGWTRTTDALGPVVQNCDGRVFTLATLPEMLTVDPLPNLSI